MVEKSRLTHLLTPILEERHLFLVDLTISPENVITIHIDSLQGTNIASCIEVSKALEALLDRDSEDFELTVSTAGIGYPFKVPGQFEKNLGRPVEAKMTQGAKITGKLERYTENEVVLLVEEKVAIEGRKKKETVTRERIIPLAEIREIKDIVIF